MSSSILLMIMICLFGELRADIPRAAIPVLKINKISLLTQIEVTVEDTTSVGDADTVFTLTVGDSSGDVSSQKYYPLDNDFTPGNAVQTLNFVFKGTEDFSDKENYFLLIGVNNNVTTLEGSVLIHLNPIPKDPIASQIVGDGSLRIKENLNGWEICDVATTTAVPLTCKDGTKLGSHRCYALGMGAKTTGSYAMCSSTTTEPSVPVLVKSVTAEAATENPTPTNITLEYATSPDTPGILHIDSDVAIDKGEIVFYKETLSLVNICLNEATCAIDNYVPSDSRYKIILVKKAETGNQAAGSVEVPFQDSNLEVIKLEATILETRWIYHEDAYTATLTTIEGDDNIPFHTVKSDCKDHVSYFCYAYYVNIKADAKYTVSVMPDKDPATDVLNQVTSGLIDMATRKLPKIANNLLENIIINKQYKKESGYLELEICYTHNSKYDLENMQIEVVLISQSRQWRRIIKTDIQKAEQRQCHLNTYALNSEKDIESMLTALVIQRNLTDNNILSYHKMDLNTAAPRAIKPEVDNGSGGSSSTLAIVGAAIAGIACLMALVAAAVMFVMKINRDDDGLQQPLHRYNIEDFSTIHGLDNPIPAM